VQSVHSISLITQSDPMLTIISRIDSIPASDSSILLIGETGVGKELVAEYIHHTSVRSGNPFIKVGLAALPPDLLETELFGHARGAYTSAVGEKKGLFELANTGSIFLDDIDDFPILLQSKLLRVLESKELMRVGGEVPIPVDVRLITASKVDLKELVNRGLFRADLYYRINVVPLVIPPLRERAGDVPLLVDHFLRRFSADGVPEIAGDAMKALVRYPWPGNIRELRNTIQRITLFARGRITLQDLPPEVREENPLDLMIKACNRCFAEDNMSFDEVVTCLEKNLIRRALKESAGNRSHAARLLGMNLSTLRDKLKKYNLPDQTQAD
jgi:transcriptional regulator with PAS, ATPase and Fis domain